MANELPFESALNGKLVPRLHRSVAVKILGGEKNEGVVIGIFGNRVLILGIQSLVLEVT